VQVAEDVPSLWCLTVRYQIYLAIPMLTSDTSEFQETSLEALRDALTKAGFEPYVTSVGGSGLGVLSPYSYDKSAPLVTPPETPTPDGSSDGLDDAGEFLQPLRGVFEGKSREELASWAEQRGKWLYV
jgi:hypothetical protein